MSRARVRLLMVPIAVLLFTLFVSGIPALLAQEEESAPPTPEERLAQLRTQFEAERALPYSRRTTTVWAIGGIPLAAAAEFLLGVFENADEMLAMRRYAARSLQRNVQPAMRDRLVAAYRDPATPVSVRGGALLALAGLDDPPAAVFDAATRESDRSLVADAALAISQSRLADRIVRLRALADRFADGDVAPQATILRQLALAGHPDTLALLRGFVERLADATMRDAQAAPIVSSLVLRHTLATPAEVDDALAVYARTGERTRPRVLALLSRVRGAMAQARLYERARAHADAAVREVATAIEQRAAATIAALSEASTPADQVAALVEIALFGPLACNQAFEAILGLSRVRHEAVVSQALAALGHCTDHRDSRRLTGALDRALRQARRQPEHAGQALLAQARLGLPGVPAQARRLHEHLIGQRIPTLLLIEALDRSRDPDAIDLLIEMLEDEPRIRIVSEVRAALASLTGQAFAAEPHLWQTWWNANREGFVVPPRPNQPQRVLQQAEASGSTTFYGIPVHTNRVCFVLDISGSMSAESTYVPTGIEPPAHGGPVNRLDVAKFELIRVLESIAAHERNRPQPSESRSAVASGVFSLIFFDQQVDVWRRELQPVLGNVLEQAREHIMRQQPRGATNIYDALVAAMEIPEVDTVFLLSDGAPNQGTFTDAQDILREIRLRNQRQRIVIHTISIGIRNSLMRDLATQNGGQNTER